MNEEKTHIVTITVEGVGDLYLDDLIKMVNEFALENAKCCYWSKKDKRTVVEMKNE